MRWSALSLIFLTSLCTAVSHCPDPSQRQVTIGGNSITGYVVHRGGKPVKFAKVTLYSSSVKVAWVGATDKDGGFATGSMPPDEYRIESPSWGSTTVRLDPSVSKHAIQTPSWTLTLMDHGCISSIAQVN